MRRIKYIYMMEAGIPFNANPNLIFKDDEVRFDRPYIQHKSR